MPYKQKRAKECSDIKLLIHNFEHRCHNYTQNQCQSISHSIVKVFLMITYLIGFVALMGVKACLIDHCYVRETHVIQNLISDK